MSQQKHLDSYYVMSQHHEANENANSFFPRRQGLQLAHHAAFKQCNENTDDGSTSHKWSITVSTSPMSSIKQLNGLSASAPYSHCWVHFLLLPAFFSAITSRLPLIVSSFTPRWGISLPMWQRWYR